MVGAEGSTDFMLPVVNSRTVVRNQVPVYDAAADHEALEGGLMNFSKSAFTRHLLCKFVIHHCC